MMVRALTSYVSPTVDTIVGGRAPARSTGPWERRSLSDPEEPSWLQEIQQTIAALERLEEDWDGYGSGPVRRDVVWYALWLLQSVMEEFPAPHLTPMSHEGLLLEWHQGQLHLELEIEHAGEASVLFEDEGTGEEQSWVVKSSTGSLSGPLTRIAGKAR